MGKPTGFMDYERLDSSAQDPKERIKHYNEFHEPLSQEEQALQGARCMDCGIPFCQSGALINGITIGCPLNNLIPEWNDAVYHNNYPKALERLLKTSNFPEFTARVCPALCEAACTCSLNGDAVSIKENEFAIIEYGFENGLVKPQIPETRIDKKIAVIGSGPAGLAVADTLNKRGYQVTVFEKADRVGGLMMYGIPNMKLEKHIIDRRINLMKTEGVEFLVNTPVNSKAQAKEIMNKFDRVVLATGASTARDINVPNRNGKNIFMAMEYLTSVTKSLLDSNFADKKFIDAKGKDVIVIGGGDTGNDCVGTAIRQGCKSVVQLEMMPEPPLTRAQNNPWPEWPRVKKTDYGQEEAISVFGHDPRLFQTTVEEFVLDKDGNVAGVKTVKLKFDVVDGKSTMNKVAGSEEVLPAQLVLIAAGFVGCDDKLAGYFNVEMTERCNVRADENFRTSNEKIYVAGDMRRGQSLIVYAMNEGRLAAKVIDRDFMGYTNIE